MKLKIIILLPFSIMATYVSGQSNKTELFDTIKLQEIVITGNRLPIQLKKNPGAASFVSQDILKTMPKSIGIEEALRLVPGVRIDNQHDGERVHVSIRGQGILTERGLRGIGVLIDGIPVNDPSGFAPDLYDVDWSTVKKIEVLRGPAAGLYGGGGSAGIINIVTNNGGNKPLGVEINQSLGSNKFSKSLIQLDGTNNELDYRINYSRTDGGGYRDHQGFWSNKVYEKINFKPNGKLLLTQTISHTDYFQQNPEGLNLSQFNDLQQANPDARPFNEYQKTNRTTLGISSNYQFNNSNDFQVTAFYRLWKYKETSNKCAEYRDYNVPGMSAQYNLHLGSGSIKNHISLGVDLRWQNIDIYKLQSASNPDRKESIDETNLETDSLLANQIIRQKSIGLFALYKLEIGKMNILASLRHDKMSNELNNKMFGLDSATTSKNFDKLSARVGLSYNFNDAITAFANWSQGFTPPSTEELASNPVGYSGFNTHLVPAKSNSIELGLRGFVNSSIYYEITGFIMNTEDDFFRFKQSGRGNQEVFYGNAGNSKRKGIETYLSLKPIEKLNIQLAYTYSDFKYTSATIDPIYTDPMYVLTTPPAEGQWLPNSPKHQLYSEISYRFKNLSLSCGTEYQSKWAIYTDSKAYRGALDPAIFQNWQSGFTLVNTRATYQWSIRKINGEFTLAVRNLFSKKYMAFTEPDPDGNSYQPGPSREIFGTIKVKF